MSEFIIVTERDFSVRAREVIRELGNGAYVLLRVAVAGPHFPLRDAPPFVRIVGRNGTAESLMAEVSADQKELRGYFPTDTSLTGRVEFGYGSRALGSLTIENLEPEKLDARRIEIETKVRPVTSRDLGPFKGIRER